MLGLVVCKSCPRNYWWLWEFGSPSPYSVGHGHAAAYSADKSIARQHLHREWYAIIGWKVVRFVYCKLFCLTITVCPAKTHERPRRHHTGAHLGSPNPDAQTNPILAALLRPKRVPAGQPMPRCPDKPHIGSLTEAQKGTSWAAHAQMPAEIVNGLDMGMLDGVYLSIRLLNYRGL